MYDSPLRRDNQVEMMMNESGGSYAGMLVSNPIEMLARVRPAKAMSRLQPVCVREGDFQAIVSPIAAVL